MAWPLHQARADSEAGYRLSDQAQQLRLLAGGHDRRATVLAVISGKGGVGKTSVAVNLAICLSATEGVVAILDADLGLANADLVLGVQPRLNLADVLEGRGSLADIIVEAPGGCLLVPGASGLTQMANLPELQRHRLMQCIAELESRLDYLIVDCGAGISRNVTSVAAGADIVLVLLTAEPPAMADAYATIKVLSGLGAGDRLGTVVNMAPTRQHAERTAERIAQVARRFLGVEIHDFGYILADEHVGRAVCRKTPVVLAYPRSPAAMCLMTLASKLTEDESRSCDALGFVRRVVNMFF